MRAVLTGNLHDLAADYDRVDTTCRAEMAAVVERNAKAGNRLAQSYARRSSGHHGIHYPDSFRATKDNATSWTYGPSRAFGPQGGMSFEEGSRNQPPHRDLARSLEVQGPKFRVDVRDLAGRFYP